MSHEILKSTGVAGKIFVFMTSKYMYPKRRSRTAQLIKMLCRILKRSNNIDMYIVVINHTIHSNQKQKNQLLG